MIAARKTKMVENLFPQLWWGLEIFPQIKEKLASFWEGLSTKEIFMELLFAIKFPWITFFRNRIGRSFIFFRNIYLVRINQGYWRRWIHLDILDISILIIFKSYTCNIRNLATTWRLFRFSMTFNYTWIYFNNCKQNQHFFTRVGHWVGGSFALTHLQGLRPCSILLD